MEFIRNKRLLALIGIITLILGTMLPYLTLSFLGFSQSVSLWGYWEGKVILVLTLANALFIFKDYISKYFPKMLTTDLGKKVTNANPKMSLIPTILVIGFVIYLNTKFDFNSELLKNGVGFYLLWVGIICLIAHAILYKKPVETSVNNNVNYNNQNGNSQVNYGMPNIQQTPQQSPDFNQQVNPMANAQQFPTENKKFCPNCGSPVDAMAIQCPKCGNKL